MGFNNMAVVIGGAILQPLVGAILDGTSNGAMDHGVQVYTAASYEKALLIIPVIYLIGLIVSLAFIKETHCKAKY